jgi:hypothetical protein
MVKLFITLVLGRLFGVLKLGSMVKCRGDFRAIGREVGRRLGLSVAMVWLAGVLWFVVIRFGRGVVAQGLLPIRILH